MSDPLTPSALAAVPEVRRALAALGKRPERELSDEGLALLLAVREAVLDQVAGELERHGEGKRGWPVGAVRYAADFVRTLKRGAK